MHPQGCRSDRSRAVGARRATVVAAAFLAVAAVTVLPAALADPEQSTTTSSPPPAFPLDEHGYVNSAARCDDDQAAVAFGRTARALVAICVGRDGQLEYRGVRLSDRASVHMPAGKTGDGAIVATNAGVTYAVSPSMLLVSEGDTVLYRDAWVEFRQPRFSDAPKTGGTTAIPTTTVSTTTVTMSPRPGGN